MIGFREILVLTGIGLMIMTVLLGIMVDNGTIDKDWNYYKWIFLIIGFVVAAAGARYYGASKDQMYEVNGENDKQDVVRRGWTENEKERVRERQNGRCNRCGKPPPRWEYHHRDGDRSNNNLSNCEGLCPNCHSVKTHDN